MSSIPQLHQYLTDIVCRFEKEMFMRFMDLQVHFPIHLFDGVELDEVVSCHWMFLLERYMKVLNGFVRQMVKP